MTNLEVFRTAAEFGYKGYYEHDTGKFTFTPFHEVSEPEGRRITHRMDVTTVRHMDRYALYDWLHGDFEPEGNWPRGRVEGVIIE